MAVTSEANSTNNFLYLASAHSRTRIGGTGTVVGTQDSEQFIVDDRPGLIAFDPSLNAGGDEIVLTGKAEEWHADRFFNLVRLTHGDQALVLPVGINATMLSFADGLRPLVYTVATDSITIGNQAVVVDPMAITAKSDTFSLGWDTPWPANPGQMFLVEGGEAALGADAVIYGTTAAERVIALSGELHFDPSFNRGGDVIVTDKPLADFTASRSGSSVTLAAAGIELTIPVGTAGLELQFADGSETLRYDPALGQVVIGAQAIGLDPLHLAAIA